MKVQQLKLGLALLGSVLGGSVMAFHEDMPKGAKFYPEQSQEQIRQQQAMTGQVPVVGQVEHPALAESGAPTLTTDSDSSFASANEARAAATFGNAANAIKSSGGPKWLFFAVMSLGLLLLAVVGIKLYTDKAVPMPKSLRS